MTYSCFRRFPNIFLVSFGCRDTVLHQNQDATTAVAAAHADSDADGSLQLEPAMVRVDGAKVDAHGALAQRAVPKAATAERGIAYKKVEAD